MSNKLNASTNCKKCLSQKGATAVEYLIGLVAIVIILLAPVSDGKNIVQLLVDAIKKEHAAYVYAASLPRLP